ncbi:MAG: hypothetical protein ACPLTR_09555 [Thermacetogeniaceae bacterium]
MHDFLDTGYITTFSGTVLAVAVIVQFTKSLVKRVFSDRAVRVYAFIWALIFVVAVNIYKGSYAVRASELPLKILLTIVNAIIVTLAAIGGYEVVTDPNAEKQKPARDGGFKDN